MKITQLSPSRVSQRSYNICGSFVCLFSRVPCFNNANFVGAVLGVGFARGLAAVDLGVEVFLCLGL